MKECVKITRRKILAALPGTQWEVCDKVKKTLGVTSVTRHLRQLMLEGLVCTRGLVREGTRGKPSAIYDRTTTQLDAVFSILNGVWK